MAVKILGDLEVTGSKNIAASDVPNLAASKITSGTLAAARIPNLDAGKITTGTISSSRLPTTSWTPDKYLFTTAQTYTSSNTSIAVNSTRDITGSTATTISGNRISFPAAGMYLISWNINWESEYNNRSNFGASAKVNGTVVAGGTDIQYFRYNTYGHKSTTGVTFAVDVSASDTLEFFTFLQHGVANHKVSSVNGDGGAITILRLS